VLPTRTVIPVPKRAGRLTRAEAVLLNSGLHLPRGPSVGDALNDLPNPNVFPTLLKSDEVRLNEIVLAAAEEQASDYARRLRGLVRDGDDFSRPRDWDLRLLTSSARTDHTLESQARFRRTPHGETEPVSRFYKLDPEGLCNTLRAGSGSERGAFTSPRPIHPLLPRVLSNREAARLHSFPDWFRVHATKWHGFRQIGNAVVPFVGRAVGAAVVSALGLRPTAPTEPVPLGDVALLRMTMSRAASYFDADAAFMPAKRTRGAVPGLLPVETSDETAKPPQSVDQLVSA